MWTNESPTVEGWYWYIENVDTETLLLSIVQVIDCDGVMLALLYEDTNNVQEMKGNWSGPLVPPINSITGVE